MNDTGDSTAIWCPHVTVATVVSDGDRYLMVEERIRDELRYNQPAGHLEPDEGLQQAALRETLEETGWDVELTGFIGVHQWRSPVYADHMVRFSFCARPLRHHAGRPLDDGICRALWLRRDEIRALGDKLRSPLVMLSLDAWLGGRRFPLDAIAQVAADAPAT